MGSINTACFVSHQTITPGDACVVIPIVQARTHEPVVLPGSTPETLYGAASSRSNAQRAWLPVGPFLEAEYEDTGRFELTDTPANRVRLLAFVQAALTKAPAVKEGASAALESAFDLPKLMAAQTPALLSYLSDWSCPSTDIEMDDEFEGCPVEGISDTFFQQALLCWDSIFRLDREHRLFWKHPDDVIRPLSMAVMHRAAYDHLVGLTAAKVNFAREPNDMLSFFTRAVHSVFPPEQSMQRMDASARRILPKRLATTLRATVPLASASLPGEDAVYYAAARAHLAGEATLEQAFQRVSPWLQDRYAWAGVQSLNCAFEPYAYAHQDDLNELGVAYARAVSDICAAVTRRRNLGLYGPGKTYRCAAQDLAVFEALRHFGPFAYNGYLAVTAVVADPNRRGYLQVDFECSMGRDELQLTLSKFLNANPDAHILRDSLSRL